MSSDTRYFMITSATSLIFLSSRLDNLTPTLNFDDDIIPPESVEMALRTRVKKSYCPKETIAGGYRYNLLC